MTDTELTVGMTKTVEEIVNMNKSASAMHSGSLSVYATPAMCALMERAASELADENLAEDLTSVGAEIAVTHRAPTPVGMKVRAVAKITKIEGRRIDFEIKAFDDKEEIGGGTHTRVIVSRKKFTERTAAKLAGEQ